MIYSFLAKEEGKLSLYDVEVVDVLKEETMETRWFERGCLWFDCKNEDSVQGRVSQMKTSWEIPVILEWGRWVQEVKNLDWGDCYAREL